ELADEHGRLDDDPVADHRRDVRVEHATRYELQRVHVAADRDGVAGVVTRVVPDDEIALLGEIVGELALALVTPVGADDHRSGHQRLRASATAVTLEAG